MTYNPHKRESVLQNFLNVAGLIGLFAWLGLTHWLPRKAAALARGGS